MLPLHEVARRSLDPYAGLDTLIFLTQCASLIQKIQLKLEMGEARRDDPFLRSP